MFNVDETYTHIEKELKKLGYEGIEVFKEVNDKYWVVIPKLPDGRKEYWFGEGPMAIDKENGYFCDLEPNDPFWSDLAKLQIPISG